MSQNKVLYLLGLRGKFEIRTEPVPEPAEGEVLVEVHATALNPIDWKVREEPWLKPEDFPTSLGLDAAGVVKKVGAGVQGLAVGDRVLHAGSLTQKLFTFRQYTTIPAQFVAKIPDSLTFDQAATIPLTLITAAFGLYDKKQEPFGGIGLYPPWEEGGRGKYSGEPMLVVGGASAVGQFAIQFAKLSGFSPIITTASKHNEAYLKSLGATHVIDRHTPPSAVGAAIQQATSDKPLKYIYDAVATPESQKASYALLGPGGLLHSALPIDPALAKDKLTDGRYVAHTFADTLMPSSRDTLVALIKALPGLLEAGEIRPNKVELLPNGLAGIPDGLEKLKAGVSAVKLVARPAETP